MNEGVELLPGRCSIYRALVRHGQIATDGMAKLFEASRGTHSGALFGVGPTGRPWAQSPRAEYITVCVMFVLVL
jgi:hypothetical protein